VVLLVRKQVSPFVTAKAEALVQALVNELADSAR